MSDEEFQNNLQAIEEGKLNFSEDEQDIINAWIAKLSEPLETEEENAVRNEYARTLARLTTEEKQLLPPFTEMPEGGDLPPLSAPAPSPKKLSFPTWKMPCSNAYRRQGSPSPTPRRRERNVPMMMTPDDNEFEDVEEMARIIAQSKGHTFTEFVMAISRHTADSGQALRSAMKTETTSFKEYVDRVLARRLKDLAQVLDQEHNTELQRIKKDIEKWELELTHVKRRIKEMIPDFDLDEYKQGSQYLKRIFNLDTPGSERLDALHKYAEDLAVATQLYTHHGCKVIKCNEVLSKNVEGLKAKIMNLETTECMKQQTHSQDMNYNIAEYHKLKEERDLLRNEIAEILAETQQRES